MTIRTAVALFVMVVLSAAQTVASSAKPIASNSEVSPATKAFTNAFAKAIATALGNYGEWWNVLSEDEKDSFIQGYTDAMHHAGSVTNRFCQEEGKKQRPGLAVDEHVKQLMSVCIVLEEFDFRVTSPLKPYLDEFYGDPQNARIPTFLAMKHIRDDISGKKTAEQLRDELNDWRRLFKQPLSDSGSAANSPVLVTPSQQPAE